MKQNISILLVTLFLSTGFCNAQTEDSGNNKLARKMEKFFVQTLIDNYGYNRDEILYRIFFENFYRNDGEYYLLVNRKKMAELNKELFQDSAFYYFYDETYFVSTADSVPIVQKKLEEIGKKNVRVSLNQDQYRGTVADSKYKVQLNENGYLKYGIFDENKNSDILKNIQQLWDAKGKQQNMFELVELGLAKPEELKQDEVRTFAALVFWQYLCNITNYDLNSRTKKSKYEIY